MRPSVRSSIHLSVMLSPPKPLDEIQPNLVCVCVTHMNGVCNVKLFCPASWGPGEWSKGQISLNFKYKVNFKDFIPNFVCVLTHERYKTTKHIRRDFHSVAWVMPQGWDFGALGVPMGSKKSNMAMWHIKSTGMTSKT